MGRRGYVAAALAVMVLLVVPLGLVPYALAPLGADEPPPRATTSPIPGDPDVAAAMTCTNPAVPATAPLSDVVAARMCATDNDLLQWFAPQDSLHADLAPLVDLIGRLEPKPESTDEHRYFCSDDGGYGFDLRLVSTSGEVVSIPGDTGGCSTVRTGGEDVVGSDEVLDTFLDGIEAQRSFSTPPDELVGLPLDCGSPGPFKDHVLSRIGDPRDLVSAVSCSRGNGNGNGKDIPPWRDLVRVPPAEVSVLAADMREHARTDLGFDNNPCEGQRWVDHDLVGMTLWGDVVAVRGVCTTYLLSDVTSVVPEEQVFWYPSRAAQQILDGLRR